MTEEYISAKLIRDKRGQIIPNQYYNTSTKKFQVYTQDHLPSGEESDSLVKITDANGNLLIVNEDGSINTELPNRIDRQLGEVQKIIEAVEVKQDSDYPYEAVSWILTGDSNANTGLTLTKAAEEGKIHYITGFLVVVIGAAVSVGDVYVQINSSQNFLWNDAIGNEAPRGERVGAMFSKPLVCDVNTEVELYVGPAGADAVTKLTLLGYTKDA